MSVANTYEPAAGQTPTAGNDAVATLAAATDASWILDAIMYSYSAAPTGGQLLIAWSTFTMTIYISSAGPGVINFPVPFKFPAGAAVTITLKGAGGSVLGTVYPQAHRR